MWLGLGDQVLLFFSGFALFFVVLTVMDERGDEGGYVCGLRCSWCDRCPGHTTRFL